MWSRSLLRPLPKLCRARGLMKPRYSTFCDRSLYENGTFHAAQDDSSYHLPALDDARSRTLATSHDNLHPLANDRAPREGLSSGLQSSNGSPADGQPAQSAASRKVGSDMQYDETGLEVTAHDDRSISFNMSNAARSITGVARFKLCVRQPGDGHLRGPTTYAERLRIMRMLDHQIQQSHTLGLGALASAVRAVDKTLQDGQRVLLFGPGMTKATITADGPLDYGFHVRFRKDHGLCGTQIKHLFIYVFGNYNEDSAVESQSKSGPIQFDLKHLQQTADMVIERIRDAMSFHEPEALLKTIAESMLRVLRFRTPHLGIKGVSMTTRPASEEQPRLKVHACWADAECGVPAEHDRLSKAVEVNVKQVPRGNPLAEQENDVDEEESEEMISAAPDAEKSSPQPKQEESVHLTIPLPLVPVSGGKELLFDSGEVKTKSLWRFGMSRYKIMLRWPIAANLPHDLTRDLVKQATENAIQKTSGVDCAALSHAVQTLQTSLPSCPLVTLQVFDEARAKSQKLEMDPHASLFTFRTTPERKRKGLWELALIGMPISNARIADAASDQIVEMDMRLCFGAHPAANMAGHDRLEQQRYDMTLAAMELLRPVLQASSRITWEEFANDCVGSLSGAQLPVEGCPAIDHVAIQVFTASVHDGPRRTLRGSATSSSQNSTAMVALGSNLGNRIANIEAACRRLEADPDINIVGTSLLYETKAMYVEEQAAFVNGMCKIRTDLPPFDLLNRLQSIENELGRVKLIDKGPRNIDLDIATYARDSIDSERLTVPHKQMLEREFVLRPYCDIHPTYVHPRTGRRMENHLVELMSGESTMYPFTPLAPECEPLRALEPTRRTWLMSILNVTPDSFSDGGSHEPTDMDALRRTVNAHISAGVTIIDIGGQSSRPNAPDVSPDEEISRILPAIEVIKSIPEAKHIAISVDTYRAAVAKAAVHAGAHIINDISAGTLDDEMLPTIARLGCTYIMMHMRGTPATMQSEQNTSYPGGLIPTIANELRSRLIAALKAGIRPWRIIFDPGVGFAKTAEQNAELLGRFGELRNHPKLKNFPWLVGSSRKGFIGKFTGAEDPKDRTEGTAATVTAAIAGGAEIVRVHDVKEMSRVVKMADAMYRRAPPGPAAVEKAEDDRQEQLEIEARDEDMEDDEETETETKAEDEEQK